MPIEVSIFLQSFVVGDYAIALVDLNLDKIIERGTRTCNPSMRRLICKNTRLVKHCSRLAQELLPVPKVLQRLRDRYSIGLSFFNLSFFTWDQLLEIMRN